MVSIDVITNEVINELMNGVINDVRVIRNESSMLPAEKKLFYIIIGRQSSLIVINCYLDME